MRELHVGDRPVDTEREIRTETAGRRARAEAPIDETRVARRPTPPVAPPRLGTRRRLGLGTPASLRAAILAREILGPPKALQPR